MTRIERCKRKIRFFIQRHIRGFDDSELWNLDYTISEFVLPRLKKYREICIGYPSNSFPGAKKNSGFDSFEEWLKALDDMIYAHEITLHEWDDDFQYGKVDWKRVHRGFSLFGKFYRSLWD